MTHPNVHGQVMGIFAWHAPTRLYTPENNQHLKVLIWGGEGGLIISNLCTNRKMLTIVNGPLLDVFSDGEAGIQILLFCALTTLNGQIYQLGTLTGINIINRTIHFTEAGC